MKKNETILFREYRATVDELWDLKEDIDEETDIESIEQLELKYKNLDNYNKKQQEDILKLFIIPNIENPTKEKIWKEFTFWCNTWQSYIEDMPQDEYDEFVKVESLFYETNGKNDKIKFFRPKELKKLEEREPEQTI